MTTIAAPTTPSATVASTSRAGALWPTQIQTALLSCGIVAPVLHIVMDDVIAAALYPGYDRIARPVSELSATYAPSRFVLIPLGILFELLIIAFWIGVWRADPANRALRLTAGLMLGFSALGLLAYPFP